MVVESSCTCPANAQHNGKHPSLQVLLHFWSGLPPLVSTILVHIHMHAANFSTHPFFLFDPALVKSAGFPIASSQTNPGALKVFIFIESG